jgi:DNA-binding beta-propeller fold protein YncE
MSIHRHGDLFQSGGFLAALVRLAAGEEDTSLVRPFALAVHPGGGLLIADTGAPDVYFYDSPRRKLRALGRSLDGGLPSPVGVAAQPDGTILVSDSRRRSIERFDEKGRHLGAFGAAHSFERPGGIAVDPASGEVFVVDVLAHQVVAFAGDGRVARVMGRNGDAPGEFNFPTHVAVDAQGQLLVADSMNFRVQRLAPDGTCIALYGEAGNARGDFARAKGVASMGKDIHVAVEGLHDSLVFFGPAGELLLTIGGPGAGPGEFWLPAGLAVDRPRSLLFVADSYNSRVQVFRVQADGGARAQ